MLVKSFIHMTVLEVGERQGLRTVKLVEEWVSFSSNKKCNLDSYNIQRFNSQVSISPTASEGKGLVTCHSPTCAK